LNSAGGDWNRRPSYSICMLCSNDVKTAEKSVQSLLPICDELNAEVVVADNFSTDGSWEVLSSIRSPSLRVFRQRASRGKARQSAFERSTGAYVLANMDCDDLFDAGGVSSILKAYHSRFEGMVVAVLKPEWSSNITISPRALVNELGGWRDVNWYEDWDFWARAAAAGKYGFMPHPKENSPHSHITVRHERRTRRWLRVRTRYEQYRDSLLIGKGVFRRGERVSLKQKAVYAFASARVAAGGRLVPVPDPYFEPQEKHKSPTQAYSETV